MTGGKAISKKASEYRELGWNVLPLKPKGKAPALDKWEKYQRERVTVEELDQWETNYWTQGANLAIITGEISGVVVIDVDSEQGFEELLKHWDGETLTVKTSKGRHFYFKHPSDGYALTNSVKFLLGVDFRGNGGYVVAPPSIHESGHEYTWENWGIPIADLPLALLNIIREKGERKPPVSAEEWKIDIQEGERDEKVTRLAGKLLQAAVPFDMALKQMKDFNNEHCKPPLEERQVEKCVKSAARREASKPVSIWKPESEQAFITLPQREMARRYTLSETQWTVPGWLPQAGIGLCVAPPGNHKTWMLLNMALAVATGKPFLGHYPVMKTGNVLVIQQEDPFELLQERLAMMFNWEPATEQDGEFTLDCRNVKEFLNMPITWLTTRDFHFQNDAAVVWLEGKIDEIKPELVIIDPLYSAVSTEKYMAESVQKMLDCKRLRDEYGCSFILAHHTTKSGEKSGARTDIWGSTFLNAFLEFAWRIIKGNAENVQQVWRHSKFKGDEEKLELTFNITDHSFKVDVTSVKESKENEILEVIKEGVYTTQRALANATGSSIGHVNKVLRKHNIIKGKGGQYEIPELPAERTSV